MGNAFFGCGWKYTWHRYFYSWKRLFSTLFPIATKKFKAVFIDVYFWMIKKAIVEHLSLYLKTSPSRHHAYYSTVVPRIIIDLFSASWLACGAVYAYLIILTFCSHAQAFEQNVTCMNNLVVKVISKEHTRKRHFFE